MIKESNYPVHLGVNIDLNTDLLLSELQKILNKKRPTLVRLILVDFFERNNEILDQYYESKIDKEELNKMFLRNISDESKTTIREYFEMKNNGKEK